MLLEFACANHKSIRSEVQFSTLAGKDHTYEDRIPEAAGYKVLNSAVIYGANGSGKSNFFDALSFVKKLVTSSINYQPGQGILQTPHKLDGFAKESTYKIQFITHNVRYAFGFSIKNMLIADEYLYYFPNGRQTKIFERNGDDFSCGSKFRGKLSVCKDILKQNRLLLSCAANFSKVAEITSAFSFFDNELVFYDPQNQDQWMHYSLCQMDTNKRAKSMVLNFLKELDTGIKDIQISTKQKKLDLSAFPSFLLSDEFKSVLLKKEFTAIKATVHYDEFSTDLMTEESAGIKKILWFLYPLIDVMINGKVLICDELETSLHESLLYGLVKLFVTTKTDIPAQLIFTTHDTGLLNMDLFRRDQIWFTELKQNDRSTDLYSLTEIKNIRKADNFRRGYISGKYGAIPMLNLDFANIISNM